MVVAFQLWFRRRKNLELIRTWEKEGRAWPNMGEGHLQRQHEITRHLLSTLMISF